MADEMEWQPVRFVGLPRHWPGDYAPFVRNSSNGGAGCIFRVRSRGNARALGFTCDGLALEIHPEDAKNILGHYGTGIPTVCEHQIQAD